MNQDIVRNFERVSPELVKQAEEFQAAILADVAGRRGAMHGRIQALQPRMKVAGPALTIEVRPGDNLMIHAAMAMAKPGDVLVIDGKGDQTSALMGTIMMTACRQLGLAGGLHPRHSALATDRRSGSGRDCGSRASARRRAR